MRVELNTREHLAAEFTYISPSSRGWRRVVRAVRRLVGLPAPSEFDEAMALADSMVDARVDDELLERLLFIDDHTVIYDVADVVWSYRVHAEPRR